MDTDFEKDSFKYFIFETNLRLLKKYINIYNALPSPVSEPSLYAFILEQKHKYMDHDFINEQEKYFTKKEKHTGIEAKNTANTWSRFCRNHWRFFRPLFTMEINSGKYFSEGNGKTHRQIAKTFDINEETLRPLVLVTEKKRNSKLELREFELAMTEWVENDVLKFDTTL